MNTPPPQQVSTTNEPQLSFKRHDIVTTKQLDDAVHEVQLDALRRGMIPIAGIISRPQDGGARHEILGFGNNELADGVPGVHGETGAVKGMGRIPGGYADLVATSSLSPCPFCQCTLARQLGITTVRILDDKNYRPDKSDYIKAGITPEVLSHPGIESTFEKWVTDRRNEILWNRDIGIATGPKNAPRQFSQVEVGALLSRASRLAREAVGAGEIPIGALIVDDLGQVVGSSYAKIITNNDPSCVPAMAAWRAAGSRDDWGSHTLVLTTGPDHIAYSMFKVFNFGQLIVGSDRIYGGQTEAVKALGKPVTIAHGTSQESDQLLRTWLAKNPTNLAREYLGADFAPR